MTATLLGVDVGGTFTDVVAIVDGQIRATKVPTQPSATERSVLDGARRFGVRDAQAFNLATTAGLNAVITRSLPKVAFLTTVGHRDLIDKGRMWRPHEALTDLSWRRGFSDASRPLIARYLRRGVLERMASDGTVLVALDEDQASRELEVLRDCDVDGVAICLLHSWVNPAHEQRLGELVHEALGDVVCTLSSDVCPVAKEYPRASTTAIDVFMRLIYGEYTARLAEGLAELGFDREFNYADCAATLMPASRAMEQPHRLVIGGPAAGNIAAAHLSTFLGERDLLCADVGGTSCDITAVIDGNPWMSDTVELEWDLIVNASSVEVVTLGAGGGSEISVGPTGELQVGPDSAGADPGPACYGRGGSEPTITDAALLIGILSADGFLGGEMRLDPELSMRAFERLVAPALPLRDRVRDSWMIGLHNIAEGIFDITIRRGIDARDFSLLAFGAAGPMMLPMLLDLLPLKSVIVPPNPGQFSASGLLSSDMVFSESRTHYGILTPDEAPAISALFASMEEKLVDQASNHDDMRLVRTFDARLAGQGWETPFIAVPDGDLDGSSIAVMITAFHDEYAQRNGNRFDALPVEGVTFRVQLVQPVEKIHYPEPPARSSGDKLRPTGSTTLRHLYDHELDAASYERVALAPGDRVTGPAIVREDASTTFLPSGRNLEVGLHGELRIK